MPVGAAGGVDFAMSMRCPSPVRHPWRWAPGRRQCRRIGSLRSRHVPASPRPRRRAPRRRRDPGRRRADAGERAGRRAHLDRAARCDQGRQDDGDRPGRRHRAERAAHRARQAQRPRPGARRAHRGEPGQRAGRAGDRVRPRRRDRSAGRPHALRRHDQHSRKRVRGDARGRGAELSPGRLSRHRPDRRSRRVSERAWPRSPPSSTASGPRRPCACTRSASTTAPPSATSRRPCASRASATPRSARTPAPPTPRCRSPSTSSSSARRSCTTAARSVRANGVYGDPRRASAAAGRAGIDLIVARTRDAIQREVARR